MGIDFLIRRVSSYDMAVVGIPALSMIPTTSANGEQLTEEEAAKRISPQQLAKLGELQEAFVCAGVTHMRETGTEAWEQVLLVPKRGSDDPDKCRLWVGDLPPGCVLVLYSAIWTLTVDQEDAAERLASFRSGPRAVAQGR